jgi:hypothetical protein
MPPPSNSRVSDARRVLTEADLVVLPEPVARYMRRAGSVDRPVVTNFRALIDGRIRAGIDRPWMPFVGEQVNTYGKEPNRLIFITAAMAHGETRWQAPLPEGEFAYLDFELDAITYNADRAMLHLGSVTSGV